VKNVIGGRPADRTRHPAQPVELLLQRQQAFGYTGISASDGSMAALGEEALGSMGTDRRWRCSASDPSYFSTALKRFAQVTESPI